MFQKTGTLLFASTILLGAVFSAWGLGDSLYRAVSDLEPIGFSLRRGIPSLALLMLSTAYAWLLFRAGFRLFSFLAYVTSYIGIGAVLNITVGGMAKGFAPASSQEAVVSWFSSIVVIGVVLMLSIWAIRKQAPNNSLQARRP